jgi:hypothetical protein
MDEPSTRRDIEGVDVAQLERIFSLLRDQLPRVLAANRFFEEHTGFHNEAGANNLVDALSHLATLVENAETLGPTGQAEQVAHMEDHLRRSMMEAFEQVLKYRLGTIADLWDDYVYFVRPLAAQEALPGVAPVEELEQTRSALQRLLDKGRSSKRLTTWEEWQEGTDALMEACELSDQLTRRLQESLAAVEWRYQARRSAIATAASSLVGLVGLVLAVLALTGTI